MKYKPVAEVLSKLEATTKRLEMTEILTGFLKNVDKEDLKRVILLLMGTIFPEQSEETIGVADKLMIKVISRASGANEKEITKKWKDTGDLGEVAESLMKERKQSTLSKNELTVKKVFNNLEKVSRAEGKGSVSDKISLISELLTNAEPLEAKYLTRTVLGTLRVGVGKGTIRDAISESFNCDKKLVEKAYNLTADYSKVVSIAAGKGDKGLEKIGLDIGRPAKSMLYQKEESIKDGFERVGRPAAIQYKYDGLRMQVHKRNDEVKLYTRRLDEVTKMFPEVVKAVKQNIKHDCVLDSEGVGYHPKKKSYKPFQEISKRIKRKYDIEKLAEETPVVLYVFDILNYKGDGCLDKSYEERLRILKKAVNEKKWSIELANQLITDDDDEAQEFYDEALAKDQEGVIMKNLKAPYKPGSRVGYGVKIKPIMEPLDLTITGATWGKGRRSNWLSSFVLSCKKEDEHLEIGKLGTGLSDEQFKEVTRKLKPLITKEEGKEVSVKPEIIIEVAYEEIQKSPTYSSGYALRFPRLIRFRPDKEEPDSLERVKKIYKEQLK